MIDWHGKQQTIVAAAAVIAAYKPISICYIYLFFYPEESLHMVMMILWNLSNNDLGLCFV